MVTEKEEDDSLPVANDEEAWREADSALTCSRGVTEQQGNAVCLLLGGWMVISNLELHLECPDKQLHPTLNCMW